jgi:transcriptional regulator with PAS, ATPase and Fis domain
MEFARFVVSEEGSHQSSEIIIGTLTAIGRAQGNDIRLDDPRVSRHHAVVRQHEDGGWVLSDLGSSNGTYVNGQRVLLPCRLRNGDVVKVGSTSLKFVHKGSERTEVADLTSGESTLAGELPPPAVIGQSPTMAEVFRLIEKAASSTIAVLIEGETGTGKELVARAIHSVGPRSAARFVAVNCAALPETLLESQLFGHRRGSFTGANQDQPGLFEAASGGTVFLDEIGEMPLTMQPKLLRVLQEGEIVPIGDTRPRKVDVRVISATNRELVAEVESRGFRQDLYYRLAAFPILLPPLRERREDIALLAERFLTVSAHRQHKHIRGIAPAALECLVRFDWPGNVRELQNEIQRAVVLATDGEQIDTGHLSTRIVNPEPTAEPVPQAGAVDGAGGPPSRLAGARAEFEARYIAEVLKQQGGNVSRTATVLGLSRVGLHRKLKEYGLR